MSDYLQHFSHQDKLQLKCNNKLYTCAGCKERGWGPRYSCEKCNYHLHKDCALAAPSKSHVFYKRCTFNLYLHGNSDSYCVACEKVALGLVYHNAATGHFLHPCCAYLPLCLEGEGYELQLHDRLSSKCGRCGRDDKTWSYRNKKKGYHFHVSCVNDMVVTKCEKIYFSELGNNSNSTGKISMVPDLQLMRYKGHTPLKEKFTKVAKKVRNLFIFAITGDPTGRAILLRSAFSG